MNSESMTQARTIRQQAIEAVRPAWSDEKLDQVECERTGEPGAVRFAAKFDDIEVYQWADEKRGSFALSDEPHVNSRTIADLDLDSVSLSEVAALGSNLIRLHQFVAACLGTATDIRMLTISDLSRLSKQKNVAFETLLNELVERGLLLRGDEK